MQDGKSKQNNKKIKKHNLKAKSVGKVELNVKDTKSGNQFFIECQTHVRLCTEDWD